MRNSVGMAYKAGAVNSCFADLGKSQFFDGGGVYVGIHCCQGVYFGLGYWLVFQAVYVDNAGSDEVVGVGDGDGGGVGHGRGSFRWWDKAVIWEEGKFLI